MTNSKTIAQSHQLERDTLGRLVFIDAKGQASTGRLAEAGPSIKCERF